MEMMFLFFFFIIPTIEESAVTMDFDADTASTTSSKVMDAGPDHPVNVAH